MDGWMKFLTETWQGQAAATTMDGLGKALRGRVSRALRMTDRKVSNQRRDFLLMERSFAALWMTGKGAQDDRQGAQSLPLSPSLRSRVNSAK